MKKLTVIFALGVVSLMYLAESEAQTNGPTTSSVRRTYPGGKDDSDLTVQSVRKITRKGDDVEVDYHVSSEPSEGGAAAPPPTETNSNEQ